MPFIWDITRVVKLVKRDLQPCCRTVNRNVRGVKRVRGARVRALLFKFIIQTVRGVYTHRTCGGYENLD